ncbi:MAG: diguanylate cyclase [Caldimonas sp.]
MNDSLRRLLCIELALEAGEASRFAIENVTGIDAAAHLLEGNDAFDAVLLDGDRAESIAIDLDRLADHAAVVVVLDDADAAEAGTWLQRGAADVVGRDELGAATTGRRIRFAIERRLRDGGRLLAYSTDPGTGLPHRQQLVEHLSQLLALREREPSPMAVLVLRIEGLLDGDMAAGVAGGVAGAALLRRKLAVRLRAGVRASDVVAAIDADAFAVLLGAILAPGDAERVADKLAQSLMSPFSVGGVERSVAIAVGIGRYPQDGKDADRLLRRAIALAAAAPASGRAGPTTALDAGGAARIAANDDGA